MQNHVHNDYDNRNADDLNSSQVVRTMIEILGVGIDDGTILILKVLIPKFPAEFYYWPNHHLTHRTNSAVNGAFIQLSLYLKSDQISSRNKIL